MTRISLLEMYRKMTLIRLFEERTANLYRSGQVPGFVHLSIGQEAIAVGVCSALRPDDLITSNHRGHGHTMAKGLTPAEMFAELLGRDSGVCRGRGGSMHIADPQRGILGANGIVGAGLSIAVGAATAAQLRDDKAVVVCFFGDGAVAQGMFHEAMNLASVWNLPVLFLCENNHFAEFSHTGDQHRSTLQMRAVGYGVGYGHVDGNDVVAVHEAATAAVARLRAGEGPLILEAETYRWAGHYEGDAQAYRDEAELNEWMARDPLVIARSRLAQQGIAPEEIRSVDVAAETQIDEAEKAAIAAPFPLADTALDYVISPRPPLPEPAPPSGEVTWRTMDAIHDALEYELRTDPNVFIAGIDVGAGGNVFGLTRGLHGQFPGRVRDTPILENAIVGTAVGAAMAGMRPVVEIMYMDFIGVAFDQILNQAAKMRFMTGGAASLPLVIRTQFGAGRSSGSQHSQSLEAILAHIPGLTVVMPSNPADAYGLLRASIRDENPVIFVENRLLYGKKGPKPNADYLVPLGRARVVRQGADVTLVTWSRMVLECMESASVVANEGIDVEVIDLRTIVPWDREAVLASLTKTGRLVIAHEAVKEFGVGAEIAAFAADEGFWLLDAPVVRVGALFSPAPYSPSLESVWLPGHAQVTDALRRVVAI